MTDRLQRPHTVYATVPHPSCTCGWTPPDDGDPPMYRRTTTDTACTVHWWEDHVYTPDPDDD